VVLVTVRLWLQVGFHMILFIAGLHAFRPTLYEAAYVDVAKPAGRCSGTSRCPQLRPTSIAVLLLTLIAAYQAFDEFYNLLGTARGLPISADRGWSTCTTWRWGRTRTTGTARRAR